MRDMRNQQNIPPNKREVVNVESIVGDSPPAQESLKEEHVPEGKQVVSTNEDFDFNALLQYFPDEGEEGEEGRKLTFYLTEEQYDKLLLICETYSTRGTPMRKLPENYQQVLRYVLDELPLETFVAMPEYVKEKKLKKLQAMGKRKLQRFVQDMKKQSKRIMG
jgi:hypothetical protein